MFRRQLALCRWPNAFKFLHNHPQRSLLASGPLIELLLERDQVEAAKRVYKELKGLAPDAVENDYDCSLLNRRLAMAGGAEVDVAAASTRVKALAGERSERVVDSVAESR